VRLAGWVHRVRDHGGIIFIDLRDHYGITQVVVHPERSFYEKAERWRLEMAVSFTGTVVLRSEDTRNPKVATGDIEVAASDMEVLGECAAGLPFSVAQELPCDENVRLRHRFLDLRRAGLHRRITMRSHVISSIRKRMEAMGFLEYQTPILTRSSPEGARDFLVPSRLHPGRFYALPQAPQMFKQLIMISGFDRYFQIAPCFRDEDARADRSPGEFYQVDIEMSFATQDDVFAVVEELFAGLFPEFSSRAVTPAPFPRIPYADAMLRYGTDKPDLRNPLEIRDATEVFRESRFRAFQSEVRRGGVVRVIPVPGAAMQPRSFFDNMIAYTQGIGGKGLGYLIWTEDGVRSPIAKFLGEEEITQLRDLACAAPGDVLFFVADSAKLAVALAGQVRDELARRLDLVERDVYRFCWITDYPMYEWNEQHNRVDFSHNPFSMPRGGMEALENKDPLDILAWQYDLVCNGVELSSGAVRNHRPDIMVKAFEIAGYTRKEVEDRFGGLFRALHYGAPPHAGIAAGLERILMLLTDAPNIRDVTLFPLNQSAQDPLLGAPGEVSRRQLRELHIRCVLPGKPGQSGKTVSGGPG